jgi:hypothetical protein
MRIRALVIAMATTGLFAVPAAHALDQGTADRQVAPPYGQQQVQADQMEQQRRQGLQPPRADRAQDDPLAQQQQRARDRRAQQLGQDDTEVVVTAPPSEVQIDQPPAQVEVQQQPPEIDIQMQSPQVVAEVPEPEIQVTQPSPQVTVTQPEPQVRVTQREPEVRVQQPDPVVTVQQADPQVEVRQGQPRVQVQDSPAVVTVDPAVPEVTTQQTPAEVQIRRDATAQQDPLAAERDALAAQPRPTDTAAPQDLPETASAAQLQGVNVVNIQGHILGTVQEVLRDEATNALFVRVQVDPAIDIEADTLLISVDALERNAGMLLVRSSLDELSLAAELGDEGMQPAHGQQVQLAGPSDED